MNYCQLRIHVCLCETGDPTMQPGQPRMEQADWGEDDAEKFEAIQ